MAFHSLAIGTSALITARYGLDITGQNLGNIDTPGYSRQRVNQSATLGWNAGNAVVGTGVWTSSVKRIGNEYAEKQLRVATTTNTYYDSMEKTYGNMKVFFNELSGNALSDSMSGFWGAMNDFSNNVENNAVRKTALSEAQTMVTRFNILGNQLADYRKDVDNEVKDSVVQINRLLNGIAELNKQITTTELGGVTEIVANDLRDQRGELVKELYEYMDCDVVEEENGSFIVSIHGRNLVYFDQAKEITNQKTMSDDGTIVNMPVFASDKYPLKPMDGRLAAQIETRDKIIPGYQKEVDSLSGNFIWEFNRAYSQTRGLESFSSLTSKNGPLDPSVTLDKLQFSEQYPEGTFKVEDGSFEIIIHNKNTDTPETVRIEVDLDRRLSPDGEPDMILWDPNNPDASNSLINRMQKALDEKAPGVFEVTIDQNNQVSIVSKSDDYGFCFGEDTSGVLAVLGINTFFTGFNASTMGVNQDLVENPMLLGGATSFEKGDNDGIANILKLREKELANLKGASLDTFYQGMVGRLASESSQVNNMKSLSCDVLSRMFVQRESLSGVNEDEEVSKLITYQRAFQSAAKFISTVDQLYETLINM